MGHQGKSEGEMGSAIPPASMTGTAKGASQHLTFFLGQEEYGVDILKVQEIRGLSAITSIPNASPYIKGVMNLRGTVIPVLDLRIRFKMPTVEYSQFAVIIVVTVGKKIVGLLVDAVSDVLNIGRDDLQDLPQLGTAIDTSFMSGMARAGDRLILLLAVDQIVGVDEPSTPNRDV